MDEDRDVVTERESDPGAGGVYRRADTARRRRDEGRRLGKNEERNRLPWQGKAVPCVNRAGKAVVEKLSKLSTVSTDDVNKIDGYRAVRQRC